MYEDKDWRIWTFGSIDIEFLVACGAIGDPLRLTNACAHSIAIGSKTCTGPLKQGVIPRLLVGCVKFDLIVVHEHKRTLGMGRRSNAAVLSECGAGCRGSCNTRKNCATGDISIIGH